MFKILAVSAVFLVLASEAANLSCKTDINPSLDNKCADGQTLIATGCCNAEDVFDSDAYFCRSDPLPAIGGYCPYGFILTADGGCCPNSDAFTKEK